MLPYLYISRLYFADSIDRDYTEQCRCVLGFLVNSVQECAKKVQYLLQKFWPRASTFCYTVGKFTLNGVGSCQKATSRWGGGYCRWP
jgi:hypothetical protein